MKRIVVLLIVFATVFLLLGAGFLAFTKLCSPVPESSPVAPEAVFSQTGMNGYLGIAMIAVMCAANVAIKRARFFAVCFND